MIEESSEESGCYDELGELLSDQARINDADRKSLKSTPTKTPAKKRDGQADSENRPPALVSGPTSGQSRAHPKRSGGGGGGGKQESSVFKSANWLSDSELIFSLSNQVGGLVRALRIFQELNIGIKHVESRKSKRRDSEFEIFVDIDCSDAEKMRELVHHLR